jgi:hypothetical protein
MTTHLYSFVLKTKQGEFNGLGRASARLRQIGCPHFEVTKAPDEVALAQHLKEVASEIAKNWSLDKDCYVDLFDVPLSWRVGDLHPLRYLVQVLRDSQLFPIRVIPTTGLEIERDAAYVATAKDLAREIGCGLCLRLKPEEIDHFDESAALAESLLKDHTGDSDLLLDFRSIVNQDVEILAGRGVRMVRALELRGLRFRRVIVCSSNMPEKMSEQVDKESKWNQPRTDWILWERIAMALKSGNVIYGDYSVVFPEFFAPQRNKFINAKLRIADRDHYRLYRGRELYTEGGDPLQYKDLAQEVLSLEGIRGLSSRAIKDFRELASGSTGRKGSPASLVPMEICLHLDVTAEEVSARAVVLAISVSATQAS